MGNEREKLTTLRMPVSAHEQIVSLQDFEEREIICWGLAFDIVSILSENGIAVERVSLRAKTQERIENKIKRRDSDAPLRDIYGIRIITQEADRERIKNIIQEAYPETPGKFADGTPSFREYADPETRRLARSRNKNISERHSAMHVNIVFSRVGEAVFDIAEIQILNPEEMRIFNETREEYENGKQK